MDSERTVSGNLSITRGVLNISFIKNYELPVFFAVLFIATSKEECHQVAFGEVNQVSISAVVLNFRQYLNTIFR